MSNTKKTQETDISTKKNDQPIDRRMILQGGGLLAAAAAGGAFAPAVKASAQAKAVLSTSGPIITGFTPTTGSAGTLITINGEGFPADFSDICCIAVRPNGDIIGLDVISGNENQFQAELQDFEAAATGAPHQIMARFGEGSFEVLPPPFLYPDLVIADPWIWAGDTEGAAIIAPGELVPQSPLRTATKDAVAGTVFVKHSPDADGKLRLTLTEDWPPAFIMQITARVLKQGLYCDTNFSFVQAIPGTLGGNPNSITCVGAICALLNDSFNNHPTKPLAVDCQPNPTDGTTLVLELIDETPISQGYLRVKILTVCPSFGQTVVGSGETSVRVTLRNLPANCGPGLSLNFSMNIIVDDPGGVWPMTDIKFDKSVPLSVTSSIPIALCSSDICDAIEAIFLGCVEPSSGNGVTCTILPDGSDLNVDIHLPPGVTFVSGRVSLMICPP